MSNPTITYESQQDELTRRRAEGEKLAALVHAYRAAIIQRDALAQSASIFSASAQLALREAALTVEHAEGELLFGACAIVDGQPTEDNRFTAHVAALVAEIESRGALHAIVYRDGLVAFIVAKHGEWQMSLVTDSAARERPLEVPHQMELA